METEANKEQFKELHFLSPRELNFILEHVTNLKHRCLVLLMSDCGLRVSEVISLRISNFDFKKRIIFVLSLKKREKKEFRKIPLSDRVYRHLADYLFNFKDLKPDDYLFPNIKKDSHIQRFAVNKFLERLRNKQNLSNKVHPHAMRHTFATNLVSNSVPLENIKLMLGHQNYNTTLIYAHIPDEMLRNNIETVSNTQTNFFQKLINKYWNQPPRIININQPTHIFVGRTPELNQLNTFVSKSINVCITGSTGVGKKLLLDNLVTDKKILILDDTTNIKKSLLYLLLYLYENDKEAIQTLLYGEFNKDALVIKLNRESIANLCDEITRLVTKDKYVLKINQIDTLTPKVIQVITKLKDHFNIITTAKEIPINKSDFLWNFEIIAIKNLTRSETFEMITRLSYDLNIEDYDMFRNHIYEQTDGNPRAVLEMITRYRKEPFILRDTIRNIVHSGALSEIDMSYAVMLFIASIAILRYLTSELDNPSLRFIGGVAMILLIFSRSFFGRTKRKFV